jgi:hypothetical protein
MLVSWLLPPLPKWPSGEGGSTGWVLLRVQVLLHDHVENEQVSTDALGEPGLVVKDIRFEGVR